jgi:predicted small integral membrane protein
VTTTNIEARNAIRTGTQVLGGTAWMWSSAEFFEAIDVLFVDEAGQMALANVLAFERGEPLTHRRLGTLRLDISQLNRTCFL